MANALARETCPTSSSTATTRSTGCRGATRPCAARASTTGRCSCRSATRLPLVPRHGARVLRGRRDRRAHERALRVRQGRPRGAPRRRRALHGRRAGHDRPRRLAAERLPHARAGAVLRRHLLPARAAPWGCRAGARCCGAVAEAWETQREEIRAQGEQVAPRLAGRRAARALRAAARRRRARRRRRRAAPGLRQRQRRLGRRAEVPAGLGHRVPAARAASSRWRCRRCARWPAAASSTRSAAASRATASTRAGPCRTSRRCSTTTRCSRAPTCTAARPAATRVLRRTAEETLDWALREMRAPEGGFYSALDADSEGVEGKFYVWTLDELRAALGDDADAAIAWFGATERGNFEGANILESRGPEPPAEQRDADPRAAARGPRRARAPGPRRQAPGRLERAHDRRAGRRRRRARPRRTTSTPRAAPAAFVLDAHARRPTAGCCAPSTPATARLGAYLEDHAFLLEALLVLYEATFEERWFVEARALADTIVARFADPERGGFFSTARRPRGAHRPAQGPRGLADPVGRLERGARPAAPRGAHRRARLRGAGRRASSRCCTRSPSRHPSAFGHLLQALDLYLAPRREVALAGDPAGVAALAAVVREARRPHLVLAGGPGRGPTAVALMEQRAPVDGRAAAYVCERFACRRRSPSPDELRALLQAQPVPRAATQTDWRAVARRRSAVTSGPARETPTPQAAPRDRRNATTRHSQLRNAVFSGVRAPAGSGRAPTA